MDFVKKNIGLLLFLILCLGGIVYLVILIMGQSKLKQEQLATENSMSSSSTGWPRRISVSMTKTARRRRESSPRRTRSISNSVRAWPKSGSSRMTILIARLSCNWLPRPPKVKCWL